MPQQYDVAVAGAGIVGAAIAYECAARGLRVVLLDRDEPGTKASGAAAGMLAPCSEAHQAGPFLDLARQSLALWPELARRVQDDSGRDPELVLDGLLRVALDEATADEVMQRLAWQRDCGLAEGEWVDAATARELEPSLTADAFGAAWYPREGHVHSRPAVRALVEAARRHGAEVVIGAAVAGPARSTPGVRLQSGEEIQAGRTVLATGAWLGELSGVFGAALPVKPVHGQIAVLHGLPAPPRRVVYAGLHGYVLAKRDGTVLAGATEEDRGFDSTPDPEVTATLQAKAARLVGGAAGATAVHAWTGLRPCAPDRLPLLGPLPGERGGSVLVAGGHYRNGVLLAPVTARGIAAMLTGEGTPEGWEAFDPRRFG